MSKTIPQKSEFYKPLTKNGSTSKISNVLSTINPTFISSWLPDTSPLSNIDQMNDFSSSEQKTIRLISIVGLIASVCQLLARVKTTTTDIISASSVLNCILMLILAIYIAQFVHCTSIYNITENQQTQGLVKITTIFSLVFIIPLAYTTIV